MSARPVNETRGGRWAEDFDHVIRRVELVCLRSARHYRGRGPARSHATSRRVRSSLLPSSAYIIVLELSLAFLALLLREMSLAGPKIAQTQICSITFDLKEIM